LQDIIEDLALSGRDPGPETPPDGSVDLDRTQPKGPTLGSQVHDPHPSILWLWSASDGSLLLERVDVGTYSGANHADPAG
jgi:hypothetical protein